jgi:hypothetical protein
MNIMVLAENGTQGILNNDWTLIGIIIAIMVLLIIFRRRRSAGSNLEIAISLMGDVKYNLKLLSTFSATTPSYKNLKMGSWNRYKEKITFLDEPARNNIAGAFALALDFNDRMNAARQNRSTSYLAGIGTDKLQEALNQSRESLASWIKDNYQKEMFQRKRGLFW